MANLFKVYKYGQRDDVLKSFIQDVQKCTAFIGIKKIVKEIMEIQIECQREENFDMIPDEETDTEKHEIVIDKEREKFFNKAKRMTSFNQFRLNFEDAIRKIYPLFEIEKRYCDKLLKTIEFSEATNLLTTNHWSTVFSRIDFEKRNKELEKLNLDLMNKFKIDRRSTYSADLNKISMNCMCDETKGQIRKINENLQRNSKYITRIYDEFCHFESSNDNKKTIILEKETFEQDLDYGQQMRMRHKSKIIF